MLIKFIGRIVAKFKLRYANQYTIIPIFRKEGAQIGKNCRIYIKKISGEPYLVRIGDHVTIAANVTILTHDGAVWVGRGKNLFLNKFGTVEIKTNCFIGTGSIILPNITIGPNSIVGAGSIVTKDVPPNTVVAGNPAKIICSIDHYLEKSTKNSIALPANVISLINNESDIDKLDIHLKEILIDHFMK